MSSHTHARIWCASAMLALFAGAQASCVVDHLELCVVSGGSLTLTEAKLDRGEVVAFRVVPIDDNGKVNQNRQVSIYARNPAVLGTARLDYDTTICQGPDDSRWYFVIFGVERGETTLYIEADGYELVIPVTVE